MIEADRGGGLSSSSRHHNMLVAGVLQAAFRPWLLIFSTSPFGLAWLPSLPLRSIPSPRRSFMLHLTIIPPVPHRDESSYVLAGDVSILNKPSSIRQSPSSPYPLLSPPRRIPNPYGWMRDDTRTNATVLDHLRAENEYSQQMTEHLEGLREELYREVSCLVPTCPIFIC